MPADLQAVLAGILVAAAALFLVGRRLRPRRRKGACARCRAAAPASAPHRSLPVVDAHGRHP